MWIPHGYFFASIALVLNVCVILLLRSPRVALLTQH